MVSQLCFTTYRLVISAWKGLDGDGLGHARAEDDVDVLEPVDVEELHDAVQDLLLAAVVPLVGVRDAGANLVVGEPPVGVLCTEGALEGVGRGDDHGDHGPTFSSQDNAFKQSLTVFLVESQDEAHISAC